MRLESLSADSALTLQPGQLNNWISLGFKNPDSSPILASSSLSASGEEDSVVCAYQPSKPALPFLFRGHSFPTLSPCGSSDIVSTSWSAHDTNLNYGLFQPPGYSTCFRKGHLIQVRPIRIHPKTFAKTIDKEMLLSLITCKLGFSGVPHVGRASPKMKST